MTPVVIDPSAGLELVADTMRGRALRDVLPADSVPWVPDRFFVECGAVLRRRELSAVLPADGIATAMAESKVWPLRVAQVRGLLDDAWRLRFNLTVAGALYVALAEHLDAKVLTDDGHLVNAAGPPVGTLDLS